MYMYVCEFVCPFIVEYKYIWHWCEIFIEFKFGDTVFKHRPNSTASGRK